MRLLTDALFFINQKKYCLALVTLFTLVFEIVTKV